ncbi:GCN5-related N-acetyltransferase [Cavenderia fasciculata]|uniref:GCN5-related N-acetyltransferase n=1 Tax=Cavenderia fasciculata TaxID=261658 RepID=F4PSR7_CACFS|nr:GCN5-related N-acetyltransferase [Cavenderia fasciculata]EGG21545.1 GCN5-related N-acetyltransferase [Cavenderia fasciculata]|eukprot:XP_004359395.1 GCN5-related N-acetyltransferase [Cavenderia fasciculata]
MSTSILQSTSLETSPIKSLLETTNSSSDTTCKRSISNLYDYFKPTQQQQDNLLKKVQEKEDKEEDSDNNKQTKKKQKLETKKVTIPSSLSPTSSTYTRSKLIESLALSPAKPKLNNNQNNNNNNNSIGGSNVKVWDWKQASLNAFSNNPSKILDKNTGALSTTKKKSNTKSFAISESDRYGVANLEQTFIDAGQKNAGQTVCKKCKMLYFRGSKEDEQAHNKYCSATLNPTKIVIKNWANTLKILNSFENGDGIVCINIDENNGPIKSKIDAIKKMVNDQLGYIGDNNNNEKKNQDKEEEDDDDDDEKKLLMYMDKNGQVLGCLFAECANTAYRILENKEKEDTTLSTNKQGEKVKCGINRIWTCSSSRRKGISPSKHVLRIPSLQE